MGTRQLYNCDFEVFGKVQRVFFRKYTANKAKELGLHGWCKNTLEGTVKGQMEGTQQEISEMKYWLQNKGSPKSRIDDTNFNTIQGTTRAAIFIFFITETKMCNSSANSAFTKHTDAILTAEKGVPHVLVYVNSSAK
uniref:acylphosphatase n=1 Tax=Glossina brevipalpis TaxID=37001 RepID=A0A1A9WG39_9MUSC